MDKIIVEIISASILESDLELQCGMMRWNATVENRLNRCNPGVWSKERRCNVGVVSSQYGDGE